LNSAHDFDVRSTPAKVSGKRPANCRLARIRVLIEKRFGGHDHSVDAVSALCSLLAQKSFLDGVEVTGHAESFQSGYLFSSDRIDSNGARTDRLILKDDRTGSTLAEAAAKFRSIQMEIVSQDVEKRRIGCYVNGL